MLAVVEGAGVGSATGPHAARVCDARGSASDDRPKGTPMVLVMILVGILVAAVLQELVLDRVRLRRGVRPVAARRRAAEGDGVRG